MTTTTLTKTARTLLASTSNGAGSTAQGTPLDLTTKQGGLLTLKLTNGATGPTVQATAYVCVAHNATTPAAGVAGVDWKTIAQIGGGTTANAITETAIAIDPAVMQLHVYVTGNTAQAVTCEALFSEITNAVSA